MNSQRQVCAIISNFLRAVLWFITQEQQMSQYYNSVFVVAVKSRVQLLFEDWNCVKGSSSDSSPSGHVCSALVPDWPGLVFLPFVSFHFKYLFPPTGRWGYFFLAVLLLAQMKRSSSRIDANRFRRSLDLACLPSIFHHLSLLLSSLSHRGRDSKLSGWNFFCLWKRQQFFFLYFPETFPLRSHKPDFPAGDQAAGHRLIVKQQEWDVTPIMQKKKKESLKNV